MLLQIIARGKILSYEEHLILNPLSQQTTYTFTVTSQMTPNFFLLASYITNNREVVADYISMTADLQLKNQVCLRNIRNLVIMIFHFLYHNTIKTKAYLATILHFAGDY